MGGIMELLNISMEISNKKVKEQMLLDITTINYNTWLKYIENAFMENNNIIIEVNNDFVKSIIECRYMEFIKVCYKAFICFKNIEIRVNKKKEKNINLALYKKQILKIKSASEMNELTKSILEEEIAIDEIVQVELKNILNQIEVIAKTGLFSTTILLYHKQINEEVIEKIIDILKKNGYKANSQKLLAERNVLEIKWD